MLNYLWELPSRSPFARRRFVIVATTFSFTLIILLWAGLLFFGRDRTSPSLETALPEAAPATPTPTPVPAGAYEPSPRMPEPQGSPLVDVGQISTNLLKAFGEPKR